MMWCGGPVIPGIFAVLKKKYEKISTLVWQQFISSSSGPHIWDTSSSIFYKTTVVCISAHINTEQSMKRLPLGRLSHS